MTRINMKTTDKIDQYIGEAIRPADPERKQIFDEYKALQKEAAGFLKTLKTNLRNHQNRFFQASKPDLAFSNQLEDAVEDLRRIAKILG